MADLTLPGRVQAAAAGLSGFDVNSPLTAEQAQSFKNAGYAFCIRYVPRVPNLQAGNLTNAEAVGLLTAGLALMPVQHVSLPGWNPTTNLGSLYGNYAATYAKQIVGLPAGMNLWCDLEGVAPGTSAQNVIAYCQAWYYAVHTAGYVPGIYVGYDVILTPAQLYDELSFQHYWRAYNGPEVDTRGFQLIQQVEKTLDGITLDPDITQNDNMGDSALWVTL
ncbi:DUF1906 domain-containing protein [Puia sp.]|jgi:hypothetical protein|uniref:DUF1906 domain-containing protein n=1 Tax=Puia sp. TaxID=2045100 RepID=UPI002F412541